MRIGLLQLNLTVGALDDNCSAILAAAARARALGAELAITSELAVLGYPPRDLLEAPSFVRAVLAANGDLVERMPEGLVLVFGSLDERRQHEGRPLYNAAIVARRGEIVAVAHKLLLPTYDVFDEDRWFEPGERAVPIDLGAVRIGVTVCEDAWNDVGVMTERVYHGNPVAQLLSSPTDLLVNLSASPFTLPKRTARASMFSAIAKRYGVPIAFVNQVGGNDELLFDGRSALFAADGSVAARAAAFDEEVLVVDVPGGGAVAREPTSDDEGAYGALVMGTRDYARKCGFSRAVLGLSGGIDSALTATLAADALGPQQVLGVAMPSRYSSEGSRVDARRLAQNLGIGFREISIEPVFEAFVHSLGAVLSEGGELRPGDVTLQNIQARARGAILMAISNRSGALLLTTGNKSEVAVGYCTLYGDMAGGLAVISDVPKTMVYRLARYINRDRERIPRASIEKPPSAELYTGQTDQDTLPAYEVLDRVLELYVEQRLGRDAIAAQGIDPAVVDKVITLVRTSEYKRRQAAPGLILTRKAFGVGRRMPIAQGFRE
jgi:NAD+ synthetase